MAAPDVAHLQSNRSALTSSSGTPASTDRFGDPIAAPQQRQQSRSRSSKKNEWECNITLASTKEKAEVFIPVDDPDAMVNNMMDKIVARFPPESVVTVQAMRANSSRRSRSVPPRGGTAAFATTLSPPGSSGQQVTTSVTGDQGRAASVPATLNMSVAAAGFPLPYYVTQDGSLLPMAYKSDGTPVEGYVVEAGMVVPVGQQLSAPPRPGKRGLIVDIENNQTEGIALAAHGLTRGHPHPHYVLHDGSALPMAYRSDGSPLEGFVQTPRGTATAVGPQYFKDGRAVEGVVIGLDGRPVSGLKLAPQGWAVNVFAPCSTGRMSSLESSDPPPALVGDLGVREGPGAVPHAVPRGVGSQPLSAHAGAFASTSLTTFGVVTPSTVVSVAPGQRVGSDERTPSFARGRSSPPPISTGTKASTFTSAVQTPDTMKVKLLETPSHKFATATTTANTPVGKSPCSSVCGATPCGSRPCCCHRKHYTVERYVEKPQIKYIETEMPIERVSQKVVHVKKREIVDVPHEVIKYVPKVEEVVVEREVCVPGEVVEVEREYEVQERVPVYNYRDEAVPVVVSQVHHPHLRSGPREEVVAVDCKRFEPTIVPVDIFIPKLVDVNMTSGVFDAYHEKVNVPDAHWNGLVRELNRHLALTLDQLPMRADARGCVPFTAQGRQLGLPIEGDPEALQRRTRRTRSAAPKSKSSVHMSVVTPPLQLSGSQHQSAAQGPPPTMVPRGVTQDVEPEGSASLQDFSAFQRQAGENGERTGGERTGDERTPADRSRCTSVSRPDTRARTRSRSRSQPLAAGDKRRCASNTAKKTNGGGCC